MAQQSSEPYAIHLLKRVLGTGSFDRDEVAAQLAVTPQTLHAYLAEEESMPLDRRLRLAALLIRKGQPFAASGFKLRRQVAAAMT